MGLNHRSLSKRCPFVARSLKRRETVNRPLRKAGKFQTAPRREVSSESLKRQRTCNRPSTSAHPGVRLYPQCSTISLIITEDRPLTKAVGEVTEAASRHEPVDIEDQHHTVMRRLSERDQHATGLRFDELALVNALIDIESRTEIGRIASRVKIKLTEAVPRASVVGREVHTIFMPMKENSPSDILWLTHVGPFCPASLPLLFRYRKRVWKVRRLCSSVKVRVIGHTEVERTAGQQILMLHIVFDVRLSVQM